MIGGLRSLFSGSNRLRGRDIAGCVIVGGNSGIVYQIYDGGALPEPPSLPWDADLPSAGPFEIFNLLRWSSRLSRQLIGRDREKQELLDWAGSGAGLRIRLLTGPGGAGKTRLAAELAESLHQAGWHAGLTWLENSVPRPLSAKGLLLIIDYPEEWRAQIRVLLQSAARIEALPAPVRVLLLSRRPMDHWRDEIVQAGASSGATATKLPSDRSQPMRRHNCFTPSPSGSPQIERSTCRGSMRPQSGRGWSVIWCFIRSRSTPLQPPSTPSSSRRKLSG
jgi:hypothetical protein